LSGADAQQYNNAANEPDEAQGYQGDLSVSTEVEAAATTAGTVSAPCDNKFSDSIASASNLEFLHKLKEMREEAKFDLNLTARGNIRVETLSWIQVIRSKYGFDDHAGTGTGTRPPARPGRTASSSMNAAEIAKAVHFK
jgi:hypothetical protein